MDKESRSGRLKIPKETRAIPRDDPNVELLDGDFSDSDPRKMSPRRDNKSTERRAKEAMETLENQRIDAEGTLSGLGKTLADAERELDQLAKNVGSVNKKLQGQYGK